MSDKIFCLASLQAVMFVEEMIGIWKKYLSKFFNITAILADARRSGNSSVVQEGGD